MKELEFNNRWNSGWHCKNVVSPWFQNYQITTADSVSFSIVKHQQKAPAQACTIDLSCLNAALGKNFHKQIETETIACYSVLILANVFL